MVLISRSLSGEAPALHIISRRALLEFAAVHAGAETSLDVGYRVVKSSEWKSLADVKRVYLHAEMMDRWIIFNIRGNRYRLITEINYRSGIVMIRRVLTHSE